MCRGVASCWDELKVQELAVLPVVLLGLRYKPAKYWMEGYYAALERQWGGVGQLELKQLAGMVVGWGWLGWPAVDQRRLRELEEMMISAVHSAADGAGAGAAACGDQMVWLSGLSGLEQQQGQGVLPGLTKQEVLAAYQGFQCLAHEPSVTWCRCFLELPGSATQQGLRHQEVQQLEGKQCQQQVHGELLEQLHHHQQHELDECEGVVEQEQVPVKQQTPKAHESLQSAMSASGNGTAEAFCHQMMVGGTLAAADADGGGADGRGLSLTSVSNTRRVPVGDRTGKVYSHMDLHLL
jgi:hypothetical protein